VPREQTGSYQRIFFKGPAPAGHEPESARQILAALLHRAYRRPVTREELDQVLNLTSLVRSQGGSFEEGIQIALQAVLMSPNFLFRIERDPAAAKPGLAYRVSDLELASRLSFFLWGTLPDQELLTLANAGKLSLPATLEKQTRRMLADPRADALGTRFAAQWLRLQDIDKVHPDPNFYPNYDDNLAGDMRRETEMFFNFPWRILSTRASSRQGQGFQCRR